METFLVQIFTTYPYFAPTTTAIAANVIAWAAAGYMVGMCFVGFGILVRVMKAAKGGHHADI